jgi:ABC-type nitrate/sulfonate/bicarbonate transport system permease component
MKGLLHGMRKYGSRLLYLLIFLALWQAVVVILEIKPYILPTPVKTFSHLFIPEIASKYHWFRHIQATSIEILMSFLITAFGGVLLAIIIA